MTVTAIVTMADVLAHLNMTIAPTSATQTELQGFIDDTVPVIEEIVGHVIPATFSEVHDGGDISVRLFELPVLSVASITEVIGLTSYALTAAPVGSPSSQYAYTLDSPATGVIMRRDAGGMPYPFFANRGNVLVTYTAGMAVVPGNIRMGNLELIRHWWQYGQQALGRVGSYAPNSQGEDDSATSGTPAGYLVPNRVKELLQPSLRPLVIA